MTDYAKAYRIKTPKSARAFARSAKLHVNGVSHNIRFFEPYPFVVKESSGSELVDVDGNRYADYWMGHWSLILGHNNARVRRAIKAQIDAGWMYGTVNEQTLKLSDIISGAVRTAEKIRYTASGTEAVMYAARIARSHTGRSIIAKIDGGWHGYASDLLKSVNWPFGESESDGMLDEDKIVSLPYNDLEGSLAILSRYKSDLAGIVAEPLLAGAGGIPADPDYLRGIREFARRNDSLFVLDEIVTGFRFRFGTLGDEMNLEPDIVTLGKIIGGGLAIGAICGKDHIMTKSKADRRSDRTYIGGGTFSANPASMASGCETLKAIRSRRSVYSKLDRMGMRTRGSLAKILGSFAVVTGKGSLFMTHFVRSGAGRVTNATEAAKCDAEMLFRYHFKMIAENGIFFLPGKMGSLSDAHSALDIKNIISATEEFASEAQASRA